MFVKVIKSKVFFYLIYIVFRKVLEHAAHVEVLLDRGPVQPHVALRSQPLSLQSRYRDG